MIPRYPTICFLTANALLLGCVCGCSTAGYIFRQAIGQVGVLIRSVPIDDVLAAGKVTTEQADKLRLIIEVREFARSKLGLRVAASFKFFHDTGDKAMAYNLSACRKDSLEAKRWQFPIIGWIDYIGYFSRTDAEKAESALKDEGYDTNLREVDAFSTLGYLPDPVHSPLLRRDEMSLVEVVIHELAHNTVYATGHSDFSESLATFIGRTGAQRFYAECRPQSPESLRQLRDRYADEESLNQWLIDLRKALESHYAQKLTSAEKIAGREAVFQFARDKFNDDVLPKMHEPDRYRRWGNLQTNNATIRLNMRYNLRQDLFEKLFVSCDRDFRTFTVKLRDAAKARDPAARLAEMTGSP